MQESAKNANISSPLPDTNAAEDLKKAAHLLSGFVDKEENEAGFDNIIPPEILRKARGLAIYTVVKAVSSFFYSYTAERENCISVVCILSFSIY
jgi:lipid-binding SYLF domain-containing protein